MKRSSLFLTAAIALAFTACDSNDPDDGGQLEVQTASDIAADPTPPPTGDGPPPSGTGQYTLFDLDNGEIVLSYEEENRSDSLSTTWDIGFQGTNVIANTTEGSEGGILFVENLFDEVLEAPASGYEAALPSGSDNGWYTYTGPPNHWILPIPGRTLIVRTGEGNYAKVRILSYYKGNPEEPPLFEDQEGQAEHPSRYYTFEYVVQTDGTRDFPME